MQNNIIQFPRTNVIPIACHQARRVLANPQSYADRPHLIELANRITRNSPVGTLTKMTGPWNGGGQGAA